MDDLDRVQAQNELHLEDALKHHASRPKPAGRATCANLDCGQPISEARQQNGAQLCLPCQKEEEARAAHFRTWSRR